MGPDVMFIWVDAICINQNDDVEKSWQVAMMWDIYQKAETVRVWLGSAADASNHLMDVMNNLIKKLADKFLELRILANCGVARWFVIRSWLPGIVPLARPRVNHLSFESV